MAKVALLIGVSEYEVGLTPLLSAVKDVDAMQEILMHPEIGGFLKSDIMLLKNPVRQEVEEAIEFLFADRKKDDLVLLFFSGHGIKDESGRLYLATRGTRKNLQGSLQRSTAVSASCVHDNMSLSRSKRQVVILDSCFSGAFAEGLLAKDDGSVDILNQLGGEGRAILTSSTSTQYSFEQKGIDLSIYTSFLVQGIKTGEADEDQDGFISIDELHAYASRKVRELQPAMKPELYAVREGYRIQLAKSPVRDPKGKYSREKEVLSSHRQSWKCVYTLAEHAASVRSIAIGEKNQTLVSAGDDYVVKLSNISDGRLISDLRSKAKPTSFTFLFNGDPGTWFSSVAITASNQIVAAGAFDNSIKLWDLSNGKLIRSIKGHSDTVYSIAITPNDKILVSGSRDNIIKVWDLYSGKLIRNLKGHSDSVYSVAVGFDNQTLISGSRDKTVKVWNLLNGKLLHTLSGHTDWVRSVATSSDNTIIASSGNDNTIRLWDLFSGKLLHTFTGHSSWVTSITISSDNKYLCSGSRDKTVKVWSLERSELMYNLSGHIEAINSVVISLDSKTIASGSDDGAIKVWHYS